MNRTASAAWAALTMIFLALAGCADEDPSNAGSGGSGGSAAAACQPYFEPDGDAPCVAGCTSWVESSSASGKYCTFECDNDEACPVPTRCAGLYVTFCRLPCQPGPQEDCPEGMSCFDGSCSPD